MWKCNMKVNFILTAMNLSAEQKGMYEGVRESQLPYWEATIVSPPSTHIVDDMKSKVRHGNPFYNCGLR